MNENAFDKGFEIKYQPGRRGYATLGKVGCLPIIELYRIKAAASPWAAKRNKTIWFIRELTLTDGPINEALPSDWKVMKHRGFDSIESFCRWIRSV